MIANVQKTTTDDLTLSRNDHKKYLGEGRSAKVFLTSSGENKVATKIFTGEPVSKFILFILTGSANPYTWCEDAIKCAIIRRRILTSLCELWFDKKLRLPNTMGYQWNPEYKAFEVDAEFIPGKHAPLFSPIKKNQVDYISELKNEIMKPLARKLIESGFDGLVWQAGKGNPVAVSNFMVMEKNNKREWIWIDLESGLPALFAMNPLSTLFYYLPKCLKHKGWLFDDVDCVKLNNYISENENTIISKLGKDTYNTLFNDSKVLLKTQKRWKSLTRHQKSLYYAVSQNKITKESELHYKNKPVQWFFKNTAMSLKSIVKAVAKSISSLFNRIYNFKYHKLFRRLSLYFSSARYRWEIVRWYLKKEVDKWHKRKIFNEFETEFLKRELKRNDKTSYLTDFSIHLGIKPFVKFFSFVVMPVLMASGIFNLQTGAIIILSMGPLTRTLYTLWRMTHSLSKGKPNFPIIALIIGLFPVIGNLAYPAEIVYQGTGNKSKISKFILYAFSAKIGTKIPIWGGKDSEIEHFFNKTCHLIFKN